MMNWRYIMSNEEAHRTRPAPRDFLRPFEFPGHSRRVLDNCNSIPYSVDLGDVGEP